MRDLMTKMGTVVRGMFALLVGAIIAGFGLAAMALFALFGFAMFGIALIAAPFVKKRVRDEKDADENIHVHMYRSRHYAG